MERTPNGFLLNLGMNEAEVLALRTALKTATSANKGAATVVTWSSNGSTVTKQFDLRVTELAAECQYALEQLNPAVYAQNLIPNYSRGVRV